MDCYGTQLLVKERVGLHKQFVRVETYTRKKQRKLGVCKRPHVSRMVLRCVITVVLSNNKNKLMFFLPCIMN